MDNALERCFGCGDTFTPRELFLCVETVECQTRLGCLCRDCLDAHQITKHAGITFGRPEMVH